MTKITPGYVAINGKKVSIEHLSVDIESALEAADSFERDLKECEACGSKIAPNNERMYMSSRKPEQSGVYHQGCSPMGENNE